MTMMKPLTQAIATFGLIGTAISPAYAGEPERMTVKIEVADINLNTPEGQRALDRRIEAAARTVCQANSPATGTRIMTNDARACIAKARAEVRQHAAKLARDQQRGG
ncbi:MAG: hypothetical protein C0517_03210 [Erythrobacter sp.]|nr:hypothetical protein [Erythrobacter sp.]